MTSTGIAAAKSAIRSISRARAARVEQPVDERLEPRLHAGDARAE